MSTTHEVLSGRLWKGIPLAELLRHLSTRDGRISVRWYWLMNGKAPNRPVIEWQETGGPAVQVPDRPGHGMEVIRDLIHYVSLSSENEVDAWTV